MRKDNNIWTKWLPIFIMGVGLILVYKTLDNMPVLVKGIFNFIKIISPFLFAILICYFLYTPCKKLESVFKDVSINFIKKRARLFSILLVYLLVILIIVLFMTFMVPTLITSLIDLASNVPTYYDHILNFINKLPSGFDSLELKTNLVNFANNFLTQFFDSSKIEQLTRSIIGLANGILNTLISLIVSLYILLEREQIVAFFNHLFNTLFKEKDQKQLKKYFSEINNVVFTFIASKGMDAIINWVVITLLLLLFNVKYAFLLGVFAGLASFIPYLGSLIAVIFISVLTALTGGLNLALKTLIALIIFQQIDGNIIEPKIMSNNLKISPLLVIFSVIVGGAYFGIIGMFLAVPITTILKQILLEYMGSK